MRTAGLIENRRKTAAQPSRRLLERRACKDCPEEQAPIGAFFIHRIRGCRTDFPGISCTILKPASYTYGTDSYSPIISCGTERIMVCSWHLLIAFASMIEEMEPYTSFLINSNTFDALLAIVPPIITVELLSREISRRSGRKNQDRYQRVEKLIRDNGVTIWG